MLLLLGPLDTAAVVKLPGFLLWAFVIPAGALLVVAAPSRRPASESLRTAPLSEILLAGFAGVLFLFLFFVGVGIC